MAITVQMRTEISQLYVALFGRAPDAEGLSFWVGLRDQGQSLTQIANAMYATDPARAYYPGFLTNQEIIASFYLNVLGRPADAEGLAYWTAKLNAAGATPGSVISEMIDIVANYVTYGGSDPAGLTSAALFNNKTAVAQYYGEHAGNIEDATVVLATITADPATVTAAKAAIDGGLIGQDGISVTLTTGLDTVNGTVATDEVHGIIGGAGETLTAGDSIDLGAGVADSVTLVAAAAVTSKQASIKNVETINVIDTVGATFDALLVQNSPTINFSNTQAGITSGVVNGSTGSTYGLSGKGNLTVDFASTSGSADTAKVSLTGVGTSATVRSTVNVSDTNTVEAVTIATSGTNFVTLTAGSVASKVTITGSGTNTFDLSGADATAALVTLDASAATGANTFTLGSSFGAGDVYKGGAGADAISATLTAAALVNPTMTGIETLTIASYGAAAVVDLANVDNLATISVTTTAANMQFLNADSTVKNLAVVAETAADPTLKFGYTATDKGDLTLTLNKATSTAGVDLGAVTLTNTNSVTINELGTSTVSTDLDAVTIAGNQTALNINVATGTDLTADSITVAGTVGALGLAVGATAFYSGGIYSSKGIGPVTITVGNGGETNNWIEVTGKGNIGGETLTATGNNTTTTGYLYANHGNVGDINISVNGNDGSGYIGVTASGGTIGNVAISLTGDDNHYGFDMSAGDWEGAGSGDSAAGAIGNITLVMNGNGNSISGSAQVSGGDIGNLSVTIIGDDNSAGLSLYSSYEYRNDGTNDYYQFGGNFGDIAIAVNGDSHFSGWVGTSGGSVGNISIDSTHGAYVYLKVNTAANGWYSGAPDDQGNVGNINIHVGANSAVSGGISGGADIGDFTVLLDGSNASGTFGLYANAYSGAWVNGDYAGGGNIGHISVTMTGDDAAWYQYIQASGGDINGVDWSQTGDGNSGYLWLNAQMTASGSTGGDIGAINITLGEGSVFELDMNLDGEASLNVVGADNVTSGNFYISGGWTWSGEDAAMLTSINFDFGDNADTYLRVSGFSGSVGNVTMAYDDGGSAGFAFNDITGSVGNVTGTFGAGHELFLGYHDVDGGVGTTTLTFGADAHFWIGMSGAMPSVGAVKIAGGDATSSGGMSIGGTVDVFGGVDASAWAGQLYLELDGVTLGTTVKVGAAGSWVIGTEGGDNVFNGAGVDTFVFDTTPTATDNVFSFKAGAGGDKLDLIAAATALKTVMTADAAYTGVNGDIIRLVDIAGNQDITTVAGLATALAAGGEYASVDATASNAFTIITSASATSSTFYVFNFSDTDAGGDFDASELTLVGVINTTAPSAISTLVATNFA